VGRTKAGRKSRRTRHEAWWSRPARLHPMARGTLAERVADQIRRGVLLGDLTPGTRLESCRAMAATAGVGVQVIREALAQLRGEGLVRIRHGVGTFVARRQPRAKLIRAARRRASRRELTELRGALEPIAAGAAARRTTDARILELRLLLGELELARRTGDGRLFAASDLALHRAVFRMSGNQLAASSAELASPMLLRELATRADALATDADLQRLHDSLVDAIEQGRSTRASRAARAIAVRESTLGRAPP
jgi:DNA-binding FadR family transcriptional regulator